MLDHAGKAALALVIGLCRIFQRVDQGFDTSADLVEFRRQQVRRHHHRADAIHQLTDLLGNAPAMVQLGIELGLGAHAEGFKL